MSTSRKQMRDNLEEAAGNLMEYVSSESLRQELIEDMRRVYEEYNAPREKWFFGYIYRLYRRRAGDITLATKKLEDNASETDGLEIIANYFKTGAWNETSANSILMRILVEKVEKLYKYDHNPLDLEQLKRLNTLFVRQVNVRIKENLFFEMGRKDRRNEIDDIHNADVTNESMAEPEVIKFYEAPPRRKIDFANNPTYKKVAVELSKLFSDQKEDDVVKSYVAPPRRKIKFGVNPEFPEINLSNIEAKLSDVFTNVPADVAEDDDTVGVTMHGQINRFEHYNPEIDIEMGYGGTQAADADVVDKAWIAEEDEDFDPRQTEDLLVAHEDANNMGFTPSELTALLDALEHADTKTKETAAQTFISDAELNALLDELNAVSIPNAVSELVADEHLVLPSPEEIDNLIAELRNVITPEASKELSAKERFAANRKKIESHFNEVLNRRADLIREMEQEEREEEEEEEETRSFSDLRKAEDDEDEKSQYSQYSESGSSSSESSDSSDSESELSDSRSEVDEEEEEEQPFSEDDSNDISLELSAKERFAAAREKVDALFTTTMKRREEIVKEAKAGATKENTKATPVLKRAIVCDTARLMDTLKPAEEAKSAKERFAIAAKNVNTLFGATMQRRAELERTAIVNGEEPNQAPRKRSF